MKTLTFPSILPVACLLHLHLDGPHLFGKILSSLHETYHDASYHIHLHCHPYLMRLLAEMKKNSFIHDTISKIQ